MPPRKPLLKRTFEMTENNEMTTEEQDLEVFVDFDGDTTREGLDVGEVRVTAGGMYPLGFATFAVPDRLAFEPDVYAQALATLFYVVDDWGDRHRASHVCRPMTAVERDQARAEMLLRRLTPGNVVDFALPSPECWREGYSGSFTPDEAVCIDVDGAITARWVADDGEVRVLDAVDVIGEDAARALSVAAMEGPSLLL